MSEYTLPVQDMYEFRIEEVECLEDNYETPQGELKDEYRLRVSLVGTSNPDYDGEPFLVTVFGVREVKKLVSTRKGQRNVSNAFKLLQALGLNPPEKTRFKDVNMMALEGCYGRGFVGHSQDGEWARLPISDMKPIINPEHLKINQEKRSSILPTAPQAAA
ncbi:MAG: hypothetical protein K2X01_11325 [Cyanobacteria bacterium]|nr:hypothetical protein [Cyanobacteriota bacterium]